MSLDKYELLITQSEALVTDVNYLISKMANLSALLFSELKDINEVFEFFKKLGYNGKKEEFTENATSPL